MAHPEQQAFCRDVQRRFPEYFERVRVLDVGSLDINGCNRPLFTDSVYTGIDLGAGKNVDVVSAAHEFEAPDASFDVVISTEALEHDTHYPQTLRAMIRLLRPGGFLVFTCATVGRAEHGTRRSNPQDSPFTSTASQSADYYCNLTEADIRDVLDIERLFEAFEFQVNPTAHDLYFWGIKRPVGR